MTKIFVSYSSKDIEHVNSIRALSNESLPKYIDLWIASERKDQISRVPAGEEWPTEIAENIEDSDGAILLVSENFLNADVVIDFELPKIINKKGRDKKNYKIYPLLLDECDYQNNEFLKERNFTNSPSTNLKSLNGRRYNLEVEKLLSDIKNDFPKKNRLINKKLTLISLGLFSIMSFFLIFLSNNYLGDNLDSTENISTDDNQEVVQSTTTTTTTTTSLDNKNLILSNAEIENIDQCIDDIFDINILKIEYLYLLLENNPITQGLGNKPVRLIVNSSSEEIDDYINSLYGEIGIHNFYKGAFGDREHEIESYLLLNTETSQEIFNIKNQLEVTESQWISELQIEELKVILDLFDKSFQKLNWFYKSGDGTEVNSISSDYLSESREYFKEAIFLLNDYSSKYLIQENEYSEIQIKQCGEINQTNYQDPLSEWSLNLNIIPFLRQRNKLMDLDTGDCGFLATINGFDLSDLYFLPQYLMGNEGSAFTVAYGKHMGIFADRFPDYRYVMKNDCSKSHTFEVGPTGTIDSEEYNFDWYTGLPDIWWELDFSLMVKCMMDTTEYLGYPFEYTGYHLAAIVDTTSMRSKERKYICIYYKYDWDDELRQINGYESIYGSIRTINQYEAKTQKSGWLYESALNTLQIGDCWEDPSTDKFDRAFIHNSVRTDYRKFTYQGYAPMVVKVVNCNNPHLNQIIHTELVDNSSFNNVTELSNYFTSVCESKVSDLISNFELSTELISEYGEVSLNRDKLGLDIFIDTQNMSINENSLICSVYTTVEYSNIMHPPGYGDEFLNTIGYSLIPEN